MLLHKGVLKAKEKQAYFSNLTCECRSWEQCEFPTPRIMMPIDINYVYAPDSHLLTWTAGRGFGSRALSPDSHVLLWPAQCLCSLPGSPRCFSMCPPPYTHFPSWCSWCAERAWVPAVLLWPVHPCRLGRCLPPSYDQWILKYFSGQEKECPQES